MDGPDQLLLSEREHLLSLKRLLETHLSKVQSQLQELCKARARLYAVIQERSRVTDLLCQSMMSVGNGHLTARQKAIRPSSGSITSRSQTGLMPNINGIHAKTASSRSHVSLTSRHSKSFSAPVPLSFVQNTNTSLAGYDGMGASGSGSKGGDYEEDGESLMRRPTPPKSARASNDGEATQPGSKISMDDILSDFRPLLTLACIVYIYTLSLVPMPLFLASLQS